MSNVPNVEEILSICTEHNLFIHQHEDESIKKYLQLPIAHYDMHTHYIIDETGEVIFSGANTMIYNFLTKKYSVKKNNVH